MSELTPQEIVNKMMKNDAFSQWLGIEVLSSGAGYSSLQMKVRPDMMNGFGIAHGGITYSLADSALAFASNGHGQQSVSIDTSINHLKKVKVGDRLTTEVEEVSLSRSLGVYHIKIKNQNEDLVAAFKGTVLRTQKSW